MTKLSDIRILNYAANIIIPIVRFCIFVKIMIVLTSAIFIERPAEDLDWVIGVLIGSMLILVVSKTLFVNNFHALGNLERFLEVNDNQQIFALVNQLLFAVLIGAISVPYLTADYDYIFDRPIHKVIAVSIIMIFFFWGKSLFSAVSAFAFKISYNNPLNLKVSSYYRFYSVAVLWVSVLLFYFTGLPRLPVFILCISILLILRAIQFIYRMKNQEGQLSQNWYYNILYLCALEILPLLVLCKFLTIW